jgi:hypothetical protein
VPSLIEEVLAQTAEAGSSSGSRYKAGEAVLDVDELFGLRNFGTWRPAK